MMMLVRVAVLLIAAVSLLMIAVSLIALGLIRWLGKEDAVLP